MSTSTSIHSIVQTAPENAALDTTVDSLTESLAKSNLQGDYTHSLPSDQLEKTFKRRPPILVYTRSQLLSLYNSPLVHPPQNMPELKDWFGTDLDQIALRKDADPLPSNNVRDRRFRRDAEDGDSASRPSFRSTVSQPSQMGNFKHQSLRSNDRDKERDKDFDKDRERDMRDREGQERLRHLSDKYDRDRLTLPMSGLRGKERETGSNSSTRITSHSQSVLPSRRTENRDGSKKKAGEAAEDWRKGTDNGRRDRDDRERPRSRARDSSRSRRESSLPRRERNHDNDEKDRREDREKDRTYRERERDEYRRDKDSYRRDRDRDADKDTEYDDPRHWRDDGKRDERMAARRDRENRDKTRERDRPSHDVGWDVSGDRRWNADERESRSKRSTRDRKPGQVDDGRERDDRREKERDRERDREKEKEPAWMDTYIPSGPSYGILGGKGADGEQDGIQVWKKEMKEREQKEKGILISSKVSDTVVGGDIEKVELPEKQLDEIQLFKLLMKREEERKKVEASSTLQSPQIDISSNPSQLQPNPSNGGSYDLFPSTADHLTVSLQSFIDTHDAIQTQNREIGKETTAQINAVSPSQTELHRVSGARYLSHPIQQEGSSIEKPVNEQMTQYNPPSASRLLAFGRAPVPISKSPAIASLTTNEQPMISDPSYGQLTKKPESSQTSPGFSPFNENRPLPPEDPLQGIAVLDMPRRRHPERPSPKTDMNAQDGSFPDTTNVGYLGTKGSRFAKFFDSKTRESSIPIPKAHTPTGHSPSSPIPVQRPEQGLYDGIHGNPNEPRTLEDIFSMLNNSSQGHRANTINPNAMNHISSAQQAQNNLQLFQQTAFQQLPHQLQTNHRLEPLYESRLDDRNFVPDGMVPGLRTVPPRGRDTLYSEGLEDVVPHLQRQQQQRVDAIYSGGAPMFAPQGGRNVGIPMQHAHFRGGPSPISGQQGPLPNTQRLPPGLANLGGRPPHDPTQFLGMPGVPSPNVHNMPLNVHPAQPNFNTFVANGNLGYNGPQLRGPLPPHQLQNAVNHTLGNLNPQNSLNPGQAQFLAMGGASLGGLRNVNNGLTPQQGQGPQLQNPLLSMRQQQPIHPHLLPPHLQQQGLPGPTNQPTHDLMALLMGGPHRE
ncbi:hypothetical protein AMATHDRAFT_44461 [Amanita thiersii Skay4041]|uniref:Uncharacterized protein n=1 Tax=Amanita thiersii Skay4041 TaxID=703135 RepID=A0A2A9P1Q9_9AGAR|nr:hypothetical protein AMATHDRAFT_44461 [Amanita thiersii Skay4041]